MAEMEHGTDDYRDRLLLYFEEEIMGEAYFRGLTDHFDHPDQKAKLSLLADVERHAAEAVRPLLHRHGLVPRSDAVLGLEEKKQIAEHGNWSWNELVTYMSVRYPLYMDDFEGLEKMAPAFDLPSLKFLTAHEVAAIEFANREVAGNPASADPLRRYLATSPPGQ